MKKKILSMLALVCMTLTASAEAGYSLTVGTNEHGTVTFKVGDATVTSAQEGDVVTVTITPGTGYAVDEITGAWDAAIAASRSKTAFIGLLTDIELTAVDGVDDTWTFTMERANAEFNVTYKHRHVWDFSVDGNVLTATCQNQSGDCNVVTTTTEIVLPEETIYGNNNAASIDLTAFNEALAGEAEADQVSISYKGTLLNGGAAYGPVATVPTLPGDYTVTVTVSAGGNQYQVSSQFTIEQKKVVGMMIVPIGNCVYNGQEQKPAIVVKDGDKVLILGTDYEVEYDDNLNAGLGIVTVKGIGNYQGTAMATFNILDKALTNDMIQAIADQSYTGSAIEPAVVVKDGDKVLVEGRDYTVTYENNVAVGTATVIVKAGTSGNYRGEVKATFNIVGTTAILAVGGSPANTPVQRYDLSGRRINGQWSMVNGQLKKGVVIVDGKKVVVK